MTIPDLYWHGASGKEYGYWSKELPYSCKPGQNGNYIFTKNVGDVWFPIYIGQGDINERVNDPDHYDCATDKGATHVHIHLNSSKAARIDEEQDLLNEHTLAYAPVGCNEKPRG